MLLAQGCVPQARRVEDKYRLVKNIARHVLLDNTRHLLDDFMDGLRTLGVLEAVQENPSQFSECLCHVDKPLTAEVVDAIFGTVQFCDPGSNGYTAQLRAIVYWRDFLQDCEGMSFTAKL